MRKLGVIFTIILLTFSIIGCSGGKYGDVKKVINKIIKARETVIKDLKKASNAKDVAKAITELADSFSEMKLEFMGFEDKYPELNNEIPEDLAALRDEMLLSGEKMQSVDDIIEKYEDDPEVEKAINVWKAADFL